MSQRIELIAGLLAGLLGPAGLAVVVFVPLGSYQIATSSGGSTVVEQGQRSLWEQGLDPAAMGFLALLLGSAVLTAFAAYFHSRSGDPLALSLLWVSSVVLVAGTVLGLLSIGIFILPSALAALVAALAGTQRRRAGRQHRA